jgi:hypothetical protein
MERTFEKYLPDEGHGSAGAHGEAQADGGAEELR